MPHILNMPNDYQLILNRANAPEIKAKVNMYAKGYKVTSITGGAIQYDKNQIEDVCFNVSDLIANNRIVLNKSIPELPTFDGSSIDTQFGTMSLQLKKMYGDYLQYIGQGAGITEIKSIKFEVKVQCENMPDLVLYTGNVNKIPEENYDTVTYEINSSLWDILDNELSTNTFGTSASYGSVYGTIVQTTTDYIGITSPNQYVVYRHALITYNQQGDGKMFVKTSNPSNLDIHSIQLIPTTEIVLGNYQIKWNTSTSFELTTPKGNIITINHAVFTIAAPITYSFSLSAAEQAETGISELRITVNPEQVPYTNIIGKSIDFTLCFTVEGNPISIALDMLVRSLSNDWNNSAAITLDASLPINYDKFLEMEALCTDFSPIYVSETNESNDVFLYNKSEKPMKVRNIVQKILDHVGCQLTFDANGKISLNSSWFYNESSSLWRLGSVHCGAQGTNFEPSHSVFSGDEPYKGMYVHYGYDLMTKTVSKPIIKLAFSSLNDKPKIYEVTLPYYKLNRSDLTMETISGYLWRWIQLAHIRLKANVLPQYGLTLDTGDKFIADFRTSPKLPNIDKGIGEYFQIYQISKSTGRLVEITCIAIPEPIIPYKYCESYYCMAVYK